MKVKIRDTIYDAELEPIMIILNDFDKANILDMLPECAKYISYPINYSDVKLKEFEDSV